MRFRDCLFILCTVMILLLFQTESIAQSVNTSAEFQMKLQKAEENLEAIGTYQVEGFAISSLSRRNKEVSGSPYLFDQWLPGDIHLVSNYVHEEVRIKMDIYNEMILYEGEIGLMVLNKDFIQKFSIHNQAIYHAFEKVEIGEGIQAFLEVVYDGPTRLLKYYQKELIKSNVAEGSGGHLHDQFVDRDTYYLAIKDGSYQKVNLNRASVLKKLADKGDELRAYLKANQLDMKSEIELIDLLEYYDAL